MADTWEEAKALDALIARGAGHDAAIEFCRTAIRVARQSGDDQSYVYFSGRLADLWLGRGCLLEAQQVFADFWQKPMAPVRYGLSFMKVLLRVGSIDAAEQLVLDMKQRLTEEAHDPERRDALPDETLSALLAEALLALKRSQRSRLLSLCEEIEKVVPRVGRRRYVDPELLVSLAQAREYELARRLLSVMEIVCPSDE
jgi:hypothetical protein